MDGVILRTVVGLRGMIKLANRVEKNGLEVTGHSPNVATARRNYQNAHAHVAEADIGKTVQ